MSVFILTSWIFNSQEHLLFLSEREARRENAAKQQRLNDNVSLILSAATTSAPTSICQLPNFRLMRVEIYLNKYSIRILHSDHKKTLEICCRRVCLSAKTLKQPAVFAALKYLCTF